MMKKKMLIAALLGTVIFSVIIYRRFDNIPVATSTTITPNDSTFAPIIVRSHRPPSVQIPFLTKTASASFRLPKGVKERDVERVVSLKIAGMKSSVDVVETKSGLVYVAKDSSILAIEITNFEMPIFSLNVYPGIGFSLAGLQSSVIRPCAKASFIDVLGTVRLPMIALDTQSVGLGLEAKLYHDVYAGCGLFVPFSDMSQRQFKAVLTFNF